ncbi:DUF397 domain-containing protein [Streptomyces badius]
MANPNRSTSSRCSERWSRPSVSGHVALEWHKSTYSGGDGDSCVEVAACASTVHVRDSKIEESPQLALAPAAWTHFLAYAAQG